MNREFSGNAVARFRLIFAAVLVAAALTALWAFDAQGLMSVLLGESAPWQALLLAAVIYAILLAVPFVPGVELGWLIIALFGVPGILAAWAATPAGLSLSYACGHWLRHSRALEKLHHRRAELLATDEASLSRSVRLLRRVLGWMGRHPYLALLVALNIPGNWVIGGGGGISWLAGALPEYRYPPFVLFVAVATGIVPMILLATTA